MQTLQKTCWHVGHSHLSGTPGVSASTYALQSARGSYLSMSQKAFEEMPDEYFALPYYQGQGAYAILSRASIAAARVSRPVMKPNLSAIARSNEADKWNAKTSQAFPRV